MKANCAAVVEHFYGAQQSLFLVFLCTLHDLFVMTAGYFDIHN
jgi:hypothetical protein